ncbi:tRNA guanosine-2'-O-methyltransferase [Hanseniaspora valbyensis NRRL Y-1626]|uniref:tRNA guanosine-2'-O-methyltransferase n=1 Tax=Hanseniaspora valbyensis NRRL Y-1626 TaxID=766949 RepID=A0A1B7TFH6_9ASCO|nr:tRNA guanosine-2'-O-methyltransferase [Hanseniaspora valbyensis NRRL Y-1626]
MPTYLIHLAQCNYDFRRPELESLAELYNINYLKPNGDKNIFENLETDQLNPYLILELENEQDAINLIKRSILTMGIYELYGRNIDYDSIINQINNQEFDSSPFKKSKKMEPENMTMKFQLHTSGARSKYTMPEQIEKFNKFESLNLKNKINLKKPDIIYQLFENFETPDASSPLEVFFARLVTLSLRSQNILENLRLNKRPYIGTTTFEPELSLVTCNLALVRPYKLTYDPFCGTGGFLTTCAAIEPASMVIGSDLDGRMIRGGSSKSRVRLNFKHYKQEEQLLGLFTMDFTHNSLRSSLTIDAIICDPPYGIREGIKVLGCKNGQPEKSQFAMKDGQLAYLADDYVAAKKQYSLDALMVDILEFADSRLPVGGRVAFWVPLANSKGIETLVVEEKGGLILKYNCVQSFNNWSRKLLVYVKRN